MSVLIKGMKMPKDCRDCRFCSGQANTDYGVCAWCEVDGEAHDAYTMQNCPLIELHDHGDLIDRDEMKHSFCMECTLYPDRCLKDNCDWGSIYHLGRTPVVIPAERSE